jgi:AcrR family transcriptional regulator
MTIQERKERERAEMQEIILKAAVEIFKEEGLDKLSIRKIAAKIEYSPAIIYHYFKDKDDIINNLMRKGYGRIVQGLQEVPDSEGDPEKRLKDMTRKIIQMALEIPEEYSSIQLSAKPEVLAYTASLFKGATQKKHALGILFRSLKEVYKDLDDDTIELTAQIIWTSTFGIIIKLIIEKDISEDQRNKLIEHHIRCIIDGVVFGKPL